MADYVSVCLTGDEQDESKYLQLPVEKDQGSLSLELVQTLFPGALGLCFIPNQLTKQIRRVVMIKNGALLAPSDGWGDRVYTILGVKNNVENSPKKTNERHGDIPTGKRESSSEQPRKKPKTDAPKTNSSDAKMTKSAYGNSSETSKSEKLRQEGNDYYKRSFQDGNACGMSERYIKTAGNLYRQAVECSENKNDECMASKNLGLASWRLAMCYLDADFSPHPSQISGVFVEAVDAFSKAENIGVEIDKGDNWLKCLRSKCAESLKDLSAFLVDYMAIFSSRSRFLHDLLLHCHSNWWKGRVFIELATTNFKYAVVQMTGEDQLGFTSALAKFRECYFPIQEAKRLLGSQDSTVIDLSDEIFEQVEQLEQDVFMNTSAAESLQAMRTADRMLEELLCEEENLNMDGVHIVMDGFKEAMVLTRGNHIEYEAMANSKLGQLYMKVLKLEKRGKDYLMHSMELSNSLSPRNFSGYDWFDEASDLLRDLQEAQKRRDDEKWRKEREPYMKQLIKELAVLENLSEQSAEVLIKELPTKLPAKHRKKSELLNKEDLSKVDRTEIKKLLQKLILLYHPDHVDKKKYGTKYYVLCEEITKVITGKYECFK